MSNFDYLLIDTFKLEILSKSLPLSMSIYLSTMAEGSECYCAEPIDFSSVFKIVSFLGTIGPVMFISPRASGAWTLMSTPDFARIAEVTFAHPVFAFCC